MKIFRKTYFRLYFLVAVFTCLGMDAYSDSGIHTYTIEFSGDHNKSGNSITKDNDSGNHDQIPYKYRFSFMEEPAGMMPVLQYPFLVSDFSISIWQPPKI
jgi:hypothetical protein